MIAFNDKEGVECNTDLFTTLKFFIPLEKEAYLGV